MQKHFIAISKRIQGDWRNEAQTRPCQDYYSVHCRKDGVGWAYYWPCNLNGFWVSAKWQYHPSPPACSSKGFWLPSQFWSALGSNPPWFFATLSSISSSWLVAQIEPNTHQGVVLDQLRLEKSHLFQQVKRIHNRYQECILICFIIIIIMRGLMFCDDRE